MKKTYKLFALVLMFSLLLSIFSISVYAETSGVWKYSIISEDDKTASITGTTSRMTSINIPETIDGYTVVEIGPSAFNSNSYVVSLTIPDTVKTIGRLAFYSCNKLKDVSFGNSVEEIGEYAFIGAAIEELIIPASVTTIGKSAFTMSKNKNMSVEQGNLFFTTDERGVLFNKDKTLLIKYPSANTQTTYEIPESVQEIGVEAFQNALNLTNIKINNGLKKIGSYAFDSCKALTEITIPDSVNEISSYAFMTCSVLKKISLGEGVKTIGNGAFYNSNGFESITIPASVTTLGESVFGLCFRLTNINVNPNNPNYSNDAYGVLFNKDKTKLISYPTANTRLSYEIPDGVTTIGKCAFQSCIRLSNITFPRSVKKIEAYAFESAQELKRVLYYGTKEEWSNITIDKSNNKLTSANFYYECKGDEPGIGTSPVDTFTYEYDYLTDTLTIYGSGPMLDYEYGTQPWDSYYNAENVIISDGITSIGESAFYNFYSLKQITIPEGVTSIGKDAFRFCDFKSITIPGSVTVIDNAFSGNYALTNVYYNGTKSQWNDVLNNSETTGLWKPVVHCTDGKIMPSGYCGKDVKWVLDVDTGTLYISGTGKMWDYYDYSDVPQWYYHNSKITNIVIADGVETIGDYVFSNLNIKTVTIPNSVTSIGNWAFENCTSLQSIVIPDSVTFIGNGAFSWSGLTSVSIPNGIEIINGSTFSHCSDLTDVVIPDSVTTIGEYAFSDCDSFKNLIIPDHIKLIKDYAFSDCDNLVTVTIGDGTTSIGDYAFYDCGNLTTVTIGDSTETIGDYAFKECDRLSTIYLRDNVTSFIPHSFKISNRLKIYYSGTEEQWKAIYTKPVFVSSPEVYCNYHTHKWYYEAVEPTCTTHGYEKQVCRYCTDTTCDYISTTNYTANPTGHTFSEDGICQTCGEKEVSTNPVNTQKLSIESVLAMVMNLLSKIFGIISVA